MEIALSKELSKAGIYKLNVMLLHAGQTLTADSAAVQIEGATTALEKEKHNAMLRDATEMIGEKYWDFPIPAESGAVAYLALVPGTSKYRYPLDIESLKYGAISGKSKNVFQYFLSRVPPGVSYFEETFAWTAKGRKYSTATIKLLKPSSQTFAEAAPPTTALGVTGADDAAPEPTGNDGEMKSFLAQLHAINADLQQNEDDGYFRTHPFPAEALGRLRWVVTKVTGGDLKTFITSDEDGTAMIKLRVAEGSASCSCTLQLWDIAKKQLYDSKVVIIQYAKKSLAADAETGPTTRTLPRDVTHTEFRLTEPPLPRQPPAIASSADPMQVDDSLTIASLSQQSVATAEEPSLDLNDSDNESQSQQQQQQRRLMPPPAPIISDAMKIDITPAPDLQWAGESSDHTFTSALCELVDNAVEACTRQLADQPLLIPKIDVVFDRRKNHIIVEDNGIGMDTDGLQRWARKAHAQPEPRATRDIPYHANGFISRFGVGAKDSCSRLGDAIFVETRKRGASIVLTLRLKVEEFRGSDASWITLIRPRPATDDDKISFTRVTVERVKAEFEPKLAIAAEIGRTQQILAHTYYFYTHRQKAPIAINVMKQALEFVECTESLYRKVVADTKTTAKELEIQLAEPRTSVFVRLLYFPVKNGQETFPQAAELTRDEELSDEEMRKTIQHGVEFYWQGRLITPDYDRQALGDMLFFDPLPKGIPKECRDRVKLSLFLPDHFVVSATKTDVYTDHEPLRTLLSKQREEVLLAARAWTHVKKEVAAWLTEMHSKFDDPELRPHTKGTVDPSGLLTRYSEANYKRSKIYKQTAISYSVKGESKHGLVLDIFQVQGRALQLQVQEYTFDKRGDPVNIEGGQLKKVLTAKEFEKKKSEASDERPSKIQLFLSDKKDDIPSVLSAGYEFKNLFAFVTAKKPGVTFTRMPGRVTVNILSDATRFRFDSFVLDEKTSMTDGGFWIKFQRTVLQFAGQYRIKCTLCDLEDKQISISETVVDVEPAEVSKLFLVPDEQSPVRCGMPFDLMLEQHDRFGNSITFDKVPDIALTCSDNFTVLDTHKVKVNKRSGEARVSGVSIGGKVTSKPVGLTAHLKNAMDVRSEPLPLTVLPGPAHHITLDDQFVAVTSVENLKTLNRIVPCVRDQWGSVLAAKFAMEQMVLTGPLERSISAKINKENGFVFDKVTIVMPTRVVAPTPATLKFAYGKVILEKQLTVTPSTKPFDIELRAAGLVYTEEHLPGSTEPIPVFSLPANDTLELPLVLVDEARQPLVGKHSLVYTRTDSPVHKHLLTSDPRTGVVMARLERIGQNSFAQFTFIISGDETRSSKTVGIRFMAGACASIDIVDCSHIWTCGREQKIIVRVADDSGLRVVDVEQLTALQLDVRLSEGVTLMAPVARTVNVDGLVELRLSLSANVSVVPESKITVFSSANAAIETASQPVEFEAGEPTQIVLSSLEQKISKGETLELFATLRDCCDNTCRKQKGTATLTGAMFAIAVKGTINDSTIVFKRVPVTAAVGEYEMTVKYQKLSATMRIMVGPGRCAQQVSVEGVPAAVRAGDPVSCVLRVLAEDSSVLPCDRLTVQFLYAAVSQPLRVISNSATTATVCFAPTHVGATSLLFDYDGIALPPFGFNVQHGAPFEVRFLDADWQEVSAAQPVLASSLVVQVVDANGNLCTTCSTGAALQITGDESNAQPPTLMDPSLMIQNGVGRLDVVRIDPASGTSGSFEFCCDVIGASGVVPAKKPFWFMDRATMQRDERAEREMRKRELEDKEKIQKLVYDRREMQKRRTDEQRLVEQTNRLLHQLTPLDISALMDELDLARRRLDDANRSSLDRRDVLVPPSSNEQRFRELRSQSSTLREVRLLCELATVDSERVERAVAQLLGGNLAHLIIDEKEDGFADRVEGELRRLRLIGSGHSTLEMNVSSVFRHFRPGGRIRLYDGRMSTTLRPDPSQQPGFVGYAYNLLKIHNPFFRDTIFASLLRDAMVFDTGVNMNAFARRCGAENQGEVPKMASLDGALWRGGSHRTVGSPRPNAFGFAIDDSRVSELAQAAKVAAHRLEEAKLAESERTRLQKEINSSQDTIIYLGSQLDRYDEEIRQLTPGRRDQQSATPVPQKRHRS
eukprot:TRINITY_DN2347_c0_g1_i1.p1 TRINITY_DN2347_c0_g1~~TRINITY_DN2347_c0_g1_i1.p1  ORF type:complete len:2213 (+),score=471.89 TRINITY_DN2347_c0_g1_i1:286-6639(+)